MGPRKRGRGGYSRRRMLGFWRVAEALPKQRGVWRHRGSWRRERENGVAAPEVDTTFRLGKQDTMGEGLGESKFSIER